MKARVKGRTLLFVLLWLGMGWAWAEGDAAISAAAATSAVEPPVAEQSATPPPTAEQPIAEKPATAAASSELRLKTESTRSDGTSMGAASIQMVLGLGLVLAVIFVLAWLAKRFNFNSTGASVGMRVVGAMALGPKEKLLLVEVDGKRLLLGVTAQQISLLQTSDAAPVAAAEPGEFAGRIQALLKSGTLHEK